MYVGPVVAEAMFVNREEIPVYPMYRDPVSWLLDYTFNWFSILIVWNIEYVIVFSMLEAIRNVLYYKLWSIVKWKRSGRLTNSSFFLSDGIMLLIQRDIGLMKHLSTLAKFAY